MILIKGGNITSITLDELKGEKHVLFFYPKASTPG